MNPGRTRRAAIAAAALSACGPQILDVATTAGSVGASAGAGIAATGLSNGGGPAGPAAASGGPSSGGSGHAVAVASSGAATGAAGGNTTGRASAAASGGISAAASGATSTAAASASSGAATESGVAGGSTNGTLGSIGTSGGAVGATSGSTGGTTGSTSGMPLASGVWIFRFDDLGYPDWSSVAAAVASQGAGYVLVKSTDGDVPETMTVGGSPTPQFTEEMVKAFTAVGVPVYAWSYVYPTDSSPSAISTIVTYASLPGVSGLVVDAETEFEQDASADSDATALCSGLRQAVPIGSFLGYTSYGIPSLHSAFPYAVFDGSCGDAFFPQLYWTLFNAPLNTWSAALSQCQADVQSLFLQAPLWPIGCTYFADASGAVTGADPANDLNAFLDSVGPQASLWEYPEPGWPGYSGFVSELSTISW